MTSRQSLLRQTRENIDAQLKIADAYLRGLGAKQNDSEGFRWFLVVAEKGNAEAQCHVGSLYAIGRGVSRDDTEANKWLLKAAENGNAMAQYNMGVRYAYGRGVSKDNQRAAFWFRKSAEQGLAIGQAGLAAGYALGLGLPQDKAEALKWYTKAAEQGRADAQLQVGNIFSKGDGVSANYQQALFWFQKPAVQKNADAEFNLGLMYEHGQGDQTDFSKAEYYELATAHGSAYALASFKDALLGSHRIKLRCFLKVLRHSCALRRAMRSDPGADKTITDRYFSGHFGEVKVSAETQEPLTLHIKDERLCAFRYPSRYFLSSLRFLAQRALASRESFFLAARLIVGLVPLTCTAALLVGTSARR